MEALEKIINLLPVPIFVYQRDRNVLVNPAAETPSGCTKKVVPEMKYWEVAHPEFQDLIRSRGFARYEVKIVTKSGERRWLDFTGSLTGLGEEQAVIGTVIDVTSRKRAEAQSQRQPQRLAALREIGLAIASTLRDVLNVLLGQTDALLPHAATTARVRNPESGGLEHVARRNIDQEDWRSSTGLQDGHLEPTVLETESPVAIRNLDTEAPGRVSEFYPFTRGRSIISPETRRST